ncbi:hypothetical protein [Mycoplasma zalophidermidis]|uniref:Uncharacterized protein n=1 Tax=Mycoplasma zalophidermidis TaxID=398174 RepID=A0ABS6DS91_9MOLU|nr:hypothetical protein [Mycoplasma zalophidermidis]MBU4689717.1 hypothetical protein [Mycoplasma zalophidermidis]MBU4693887.1 hypothetical protein [Mycoplasma zalophidermidis]MCR8966651.1 hypothetical protein [Mycoplasma zalophidermidis]
MATKKTLFAKYYLAEKFDKDRNMSFNLKKQNLKTHNNFATFELALNAFIEKASKTKSPAKVWFHRDGCFRGSATVEQCLVILGRVKEEKIEDKDVIEFINREDLVDKTPAKKTKSLSLEQFNKLIDNSKLYIELNGNNLPILINSKSIKSTADVSVNVLWIAVNSDKKATVEYTLEKDKFVSEPRIAKFIYFNLTPGTEFLYESEDLITEEQFRELIKSAQVCAKTRKNMTALDLHSCCIKSDNQELNFEVEEINVQDLEHAFFKGHFSKDNLISSDITGVFDFRKVDDNTEIIYADESFVPSITEDEFNNLVSLSSIYADITDNNDAVLFQTKQFKSDSVLDVKIEQINIINSETAFVTYHFEKCEFKSESNSVKFDLGESILGDTKLLPFNDNQTLTMTRTRTVDVEPTKTPAPNRQNDLLFWLFLIILLLIIGGGIYVIAHWVFNYVN